MKIILFVHHIAAIGGGSFCLLNILSAVNRKIITPMVLLGEDGPLREEIEKLGIEVFILKGMTSVPYNKSLFSIGSISKFWRIKKTKPLFDKFLKNNNVDVVYINNVMLYPYLQVAKANKKKTVIHIREHWPDNEHNFQLKRLQNYVREYADHVIAINSYSAHFVPDLKTAPLVVYDWIDFSNRCEEKSFDDFFEEDCTDKKVFLFTGGFTDIKGAYEVIGTFSSVIKDPNARLLVLGGVIPAFSNGFYGMIKRLFFKLGYKNYSTLVQDIVINDKRIKCVKSTYKIKNIYEKAYCMLSFFKIPHANLTLAECIILGTPCIAARTEEAEEYTSDGTLAHLVPFGNLSAFVQALQNVDDIRIELLKHLKCNSQKVAVIFDKDRNITVLNKFLATL